jgi:uncharacterized integral membrane protein
MGQVQLYLFFGLLFALVVAIFTVQNVAPVDIDFLFWELKGVSLSLVVLGSVFAGAGIALVLGLTRQFQLSRRIRELAAKLAEYEMGAKSGNGEQVGPNGGEQVDGKGPRPKGDGETAVKNGSPKRYESHS